MPAERPAAITKELSRNDTGETGGHQAGILIPKDELILAFFPPLNASVKNPRHHLRFTDPAGEKWEFAFIYYNNRYFGGTRNEYRLTRMTPFIRAANLKAGNILTLHRDGPVYTMTYQRGSHPDNSKRLKLGTTWRVVAIR